MAEQIALRQDETRNTIAKRIVGCIFLIILLSFVAFWGTGDKRSPEDLLKLVQALVGPVIGVVGAVTGFYFGERSRNAPK